MVGGGATLYTLCTLCTFFHFLQFLHLMHCMHFICLIHVVHFTFAQGKKVRRAKKEKGKLEKAKREQGNTTHPLLRSNSTKQPNRANARTHGTARYETISRSDSPLNLRLLRTATNQTLTRISIVPRNHITAL